ncbi:hypothetical protein HMPREF1546_03216 [Oscillibacter sp. KLE 1745]|nr:hypothetical protein HMPREF1546_03216 [Oscillibacter sp. KLE 1745]
MIFRQSTVSAGCEKASPAISRGRLFFCAGKRRAAGPPSSRTAGGRGYKSAWRRPERMPKQFADRTSAGVFTETAL